MTSAGSSRSARVVASFEATRLDEEAWNQLAGASSSVFQTYQWNQSWWSTYGKRYEPLLVVASNGTISGVAPLLVDESSQGRIVRFIGDGRADYCDLLSDGESGNVPAMLDAVRDYGRWDVMDLKNIPAGSATASMIKAACDQRSLPIIVREQYACPTLLVRGHDDAQTILNKPSLLRRQRRLERMGTLACRDFSNASEVHPHLDRFFEQHVARWGGTDTPSLFTDPTNRQFYRELTDRLDGTSWLVFSTVELNDRPIAFHFGFDCRDSQVWYKPSFDREFAACSPGLVLVRHLIGRAFALQRRELDFTVGAEPFKLRFTNHVRKTVHIQVFREYARYAYELSKRSLIGTMRKLTSAWGLP